MINADLWLFMVSMPNSRMLSLPMNEPLSLALSPSDGEREFGGSSLASRCPCGVWLFLPLLYWRRGPGRGGRFLTAATWFTERL
jgi:hypothetical protein